MKLVCPALALIFTAFIHPSVHAVTRYRVTDIGSIDNATTTFGVGINDLGRAIGFSMTPGGERAFISDYGVVTPLVDLPGGIEATIAWDINNRGQVVGSSFGDLGERAVLWENGTILDIGALPGDDRSGARGVNEAGQIIGTSWNSDGSDRLRGFFWENGVMTPIDIGTPQDPFIPASINDDGRVVGFFSNGLGGAIWESGSVTPLTYAAISSSNGGRIGTVGGFVEDGVFTNVGGRVRGFNDAGQVVGSAYLGLSGPCYCAFVWDEANGTQILQDLIDDADPYASVFVAIQEAADINERGEIIVFDAWKSDDVFRGLVLTPVPIPGMVPLFPVLLGVLSFCRRRHRCVV